MLRRRPGGGGPAMGRAGQWGKGEMDVIVPVMEGSAPVASRRAASTSPLLAYRPVSTGTIGTARISA